MKSGFIKGIMIRRRKEDEPLPFELLLDADPSMEAISKYLTSSEVYVAVLDVQVVGVFVLYPLDTAALEIKNISVKENMQGLGIGELMLKYAIEIARIKRAREIVIGTSNSSIGQLYLYQKVGFEITDIRYNFFLNNYPGPIFENGIQCKHMIVLKNKL